MYSSNQLISILFKMTNANTYRILEDLNINGPYAFFEWYLLNYSSS